ncbi:tail fiber domain-containing protein, partial [candidate division KSB1 bacterium]|nr:tail fiber domain-containing protein [candidate division KSB1 bacterium]
VKIGSGSQVMLLDGNEIDAMSGSLFLNNNSSGDVVLVRGGGNVIVSTTLVHSSDRRLKKNITTLDHALDKVLNLRGVSFEWKKEGARNRNPQQGVQIGFVAQEVETVVPELVKTDSEGYKSVAYANVTALLVEAVKGQQKTIAEQNTQLKAQNAQLKELRSRVNKLESQFSQTAMLNK